MELIYTPLYQEVLDVLSNCPKQSQYYDDITFLLDNTGNNTYTPLSLDSITIRRDYINNFSDEISATCKIPLGQYAFNIYPNRVQLRAVLTRYQLKSDGSVDQEVAPTAQTYLAVLVEDRAAITQFQGQEAKSIEALDLVDILSVKFQLFDLGMMKLRTIQIAGIYRDMTCEQIVRSAVCQYASEVDIESFDIEQSDNQATRVQTLIPTNTRLVDLPGYLQKKYGVYNADLGTYIQNNNWYIFPIYDTTKFQNSKRTLTIYIIPPNKYPESESTYREYQDSIVIIATSKVDFRGDNDINYIIDGNGARYVDENRVLADYSRVEDNKVTVERALNTNEYIANPRGDGLTQAFVTDKIFSANPYAQFSELARRKGGILKVTWENSLPSLLTPGMNVRIVYFDKGELQEAYGTLTKVSHIAFKAGDINSKKHVSNSQLVLFTNLRLQDQ